MPAADDRLEQLESRVAELEAQKRLLEKQRAETEKELVKEKRGKEHAMFYTDCFAFGLMGTILGLEKETRALKRELEACTKANADLQEGREALEAREGATEGKLRLERQAHEGMVRKPPYFPVGEGAVLARRVVGILVPGTFGIKEPVELLLVEGGTLLGTIRHGDGVLRAALVLAGLG